LSPVAIFEAAKDFFHRLLSTIAADHLFRRPRHAVAHQDRAAQPLRHQPIQGGGVHIELQIPPPRVSRLQLIADELIQELGGAQPAGNLAADLFLLQSAIRLLQIHQREAAERLRHLGQAGG